MRNYLPQFLIITLTAILVGALAYPVQAQIEEVPAQDVETVEPVPVSNPVSNIEQITDAATTETVALSAIPPRLGDDGSLTGDPGDIIQTQVKVRNNLNKTVVIETAVEDFIIGQDGKTPVPVTTDTDSKWSLAGWTSIPSTTHTLDPFETIDIPVIIQVADDALAGGRYAMIMHYPTRIGNLEQEAEILGGGAAVSQRVGTLVYFRVNGEVTESASVRNLNVPGLMEYGPVPISFDIENLSDVHIQPTTTVEIHNMMGQKIEEMQLDSRNIFPYTMRNFDLSWDRVWGFGRYQVKVISGYGEQGKVTMASSYFWLIPYTLLLAIGFGILAIVGIVIAVRRHLAHRNGVEQQHISLLEDRVRQLEEELKDR